jgi:hypothetical protein
MSKMTISIYYFMHALGYGWGDNYVANVNLGRSSKTLIGCKMDSLSPVSVSPFGKCDFPSHIPGILKTS